VLSNTKESSGINPENSLVDRFGRIARKLRLSITDKCNMECIYCMPRDPDQNQEKFGNGGRNDKNDIANNNTVRKKWLAKDEVLTYEEFVRISRIMVKLGIEKIRVTGGEPLIRPRVEDLIASLSEIPGIRSVSMTTNGFYLAEKADLLKRSGLQSVNISLDTFKPERFKSMCGVDGLQKVLNSINASKNAGMQVKINMVVIRGWNDDEVANFANFAREKNHVVRFRVYAARRIGNLVAKSRRKQKRDYFQDSK
jgi:cyclic pyranopterin phosphate synthase